MSVGEQEQVNKNLRIIPIPHPLDAILIPETRPEKHRKQMEFQFEWLLILCPSRRPIKKSEEAMMI